MLKFPKVHILSDKEYWEILQRKGHMSRHQMFIIKLMLDSRAVTFLSLATGQTLPPRGFLIICNSMKTTCRTSLSDLFILCCCFCCTTYGIVIDGHVCQTTNVDYHLSFADQRKQTSVFRLQKTIGSLPFLFFRLQQTNESERFPLVLFFVSIYKLKWQHLYRLP